jgi:hypothetical protein
MHPDLLRALAKARHEDLLNEGRSGERARVRADHRSARFLHSRKRMGSLLIWAGARLVGDERAVVELAPE